MKGFGQRTTNLNAFISEEIKSAMDHVANGKHCSTSSLVETILKDWLAKGGSIGDRIKSSGQRTIKLGAMVSLETKAAINNAATLGNCTMSSLVEMILKEWLEKRRP